MFVVIFTSNSKGMRLGNFINWISIETINGLFLYKPRLVPCTLSPNNRGSGRAAIPKKYERKKEKRKKKERKTQTNKNKEGVILS